MALLLSLLSERKKNKTIREKKLNTQNVHSTFPPYTKGMACTRTCVRTGRAMAIPYTQYCGVQFGLLQKISEQTVLDVRNLYLIEIDVSLYQQSTCVLKACSRCRITFLVCANTHVYDCHSSKTIIELLNLTMEIRDESLNRSRTNKLDHSLLFFGVCASFYIAHIIVIMLDELWLIYLFFISFGFFDSMNGMKILFT